MSQHIQYLAVLCLALSACSVRRKIYTEQQETTTLQQQQEAQLHYDVYRWREEQGDSSSTLWQLVTAQPFYYHPDSGLYATAGELQVSARAGSRSLRTHDSLATDITARDSSSYSRKGELRQQSSRTSGNGALPWIWVTVALALCGVVCYCRIRSIRSGA